MPNLIDNYNLCKSYYSGSILSWSILSWYVLYTKCTIMECIIHEVYYHEMYYTWNVLSLYQEESLNNYVWQSWNKMARYHSTSSMDTLTLPGKMPRSQSYSLTNANLLNKVVTYLKR